MEQILAALRAQPGRYENIRTRTDGRGGRFDWNDDWLPMTGGVTCRFRILPNGWVIERSDLEFTRYDSVKEYVLSLAVQ